MLMLTECEEVPHVCACREIHRCERRADGGIASPYKESDGPPPGVPATGLAMMFDEAQSTAIVLQHLATAKDMSAGAQAFSAMDASETPGVRASVDTCELKLELEA
jgi:hypothetical protein